MKNLFYIVVIALFFGGCSYKNEAISLQPYKADYAGKVLKEKRSIYVASVNDTRIDQRSIGYLEKNGKKTVRLYSDVDFAKKYKEGLGYALNIAGFNTDVSPDEASLVIDVYIKDIKIVYSHKYFAENLKGEVAIEVVVKKGANVTTLNFKENSGKWIGPSNNSKDLEPFLHMLFTNSINNIVAKLANY